MPDRTFTLSRFSPAIQEMCRLEYPRRAQIHTTLPVNYITRFSLTSDDITVLLEIASWLGREPEIAETVDGCWDATLHAWKALSFFEPIQVIPPMLELLNKIKWDTAYDELVQDVLGTLGKRSAKEAKQLGDASFDMIPLFLGALKEKERHSITRRVLSDAVRYMTHGYPEYSSEYHQFLQDDLKELRIDCRDWYAEAVCELAFTENPSPELVALINKACREGYAETGRYYGNGGLEETFGFDFENDTELIALHEKSRTTSDVLRAFRDCKNKFPHQAVKQARELRDWIIPNLIEVVRDATAYARFQVANNDGSAQFAVHLLAEFQAKESLPAILDSLSLSDDDIYDYLYGDGLHESMPGILNRLIGDEPKFYDQILRDPQAPEMLQHCLAEAIQYLPARNVVSLETYGSWLRDYLEIAIQSEKERLVTELVCNICISANPDYIPLVRSAFEKGLVTTGMIRFEDAERDLTTPNPLRMKMLPDSKSDFSDAVEELSSWAWFQETSPNPVQSESNRSVGAERILNAFRSFGFEPSPKPLPPPPPNPFPNVGRNDPCPCGSGKKYKVCCLKK